MKPPRKIYLQWHGDGHPRDDDRVETDAPDGVTWCRDRIFKHDVVYVRPKRARAAKRKGKK